MSEIDAWAYSQIRMIYRDMEQRRADVFYDMKRKEAELQELQMELTGIDKSLDQYQAKIKEYEKGRR